MLRIGIRYQAIIPTTGDALYEATAVPLGDQESFWKAVGDDGELTEAVGNGRAEARQRLERQLDKLFEKDGYTIEADDIVIK